MFIFFFPSVTDSQPLLIWKNMGFCLPVGTISDGTQTIPKIPPPTQAEVHIASGLSYISSLRQISS